MPNFQSTLTKIKRQGSCQEGTAHWKSQRLSGVLLIILCIWFLLETLRQMQSSYHEVLAWAAQPWINSGLALFIGVVFYHSSLGLQVVIEDYVAKLFWQRATIVIIKLVHLFMAILSWFFIIRIAINAHG